MDAEEVSETVTAMREDAVETLMGEYVVPGSLDDSWDLEGASEAMKEQFDLDIDLKAKLEAEPDLDEEDINTFATEQLAEKYRQTEEMAGGETLRRFEKFVLLKLLDDHWKDHLASMDHLRQSVSLRGYAQKNPKQEYKRESFELFSAMLDEYKKDVVGTLAKVQVRDPEEVAEAEAQAEAARPQQVTYEHAAAASPTASAPPEQDENAEVASEETFIRDQPKVGRNDPCWCGSGKKFKRCHGQLD